MGDKGKCNEYGKELDIIKKMIEEKSDAYEAKDTLDYRGGKHMQQLQRLTKEKKPGLEKKRVRILIE